MKTLEEIEALRERANRRLRDACEAATARGALVLVTSEDRARFEEACRMRPQRHVIAPARSGWVRC